MARLFPSLGTKALDSDLGANRRWTAQPRMVLRAGTPAFNPWSSERAVKDGTERDIYTFRAIHMLALAVARLPVVLREGDPWHGKLLTLDDPILNILNRRANAREFGKMFRYRLVWQLTISKPGVFVERVISRRGNLVGLHLLPPDVTRPVSDENGQLDHYRVSMADGTFYKIPADDVTWIRWPHPTDPWSGMTPLEALGLTIDTNVALHFYNRNFLKRDGRPAGLVAIKSHMPQDELDELTRRFSGVGNAGEIAFIEDPSTEGESFQWQDFGSKPRDMAYDKLSNAMNKETLVGIGTPESIAGNASGKTFDNADAEREGWYTDGVMPTGEIITDAFTPWTADGEMGSHCLGYDISHIPVLQRHERERAAFMLTEWLGGVITDDEYREANGRDPLEDAQREHLYQAQQRSATPAAGAAPGDVPVVEGGALPPPRLPRPPSLAVVGKGDDPGKVEPREPRGRWVAAT